MDLQDAAERLGVHYQTAYRWVREGSLQAVKVGAVYDVTEAELARFSEERSRPAPPPRVTRVRDWGAQAERLYRSLVDGDELSARQLIDRLHQGGVDPLLVCDKLIVPVFRRIGDDWAEQRLTVAEEHRASAIAERLLARAALHPRGRPRGVCIVATAPGEEHGLPALMAATVLRASRWQVHHLGTQVPTPDLLAMMHRVGADFVVLSSTFAGAADASQEAAAAVRAAGGQALVGAPGRSLQELLREATTIGR